MVKQVFTLTVRKLDGAIPDYTAFCNMVEKGLCGDVKDIVQVSKRGDEYLVSYKTPEVMMRAAKTTCRRTEKGDFYLDPVERRGTYIKVYDLPFELSDTEVDEFFSEFGEVAAIGRDKFPGRPFYNGTRTVRIFLDDDVVIPDRPTIVGHECKVINTSIPFCSMCKKNGHTRRDCPEKTCHNCGEWGHFSKRCPEAKCNRCHGLGHWARQCREGLEDRSKEVGSTIVRGPAKPTYAVAAAGASKQKTGKSKSGADKSAGAVSVPGAASLPRAPLAPPRVTRSWSEIVDEGEQGGAGGVVKRRPDQPLPTINRNDVRNDESHMDVSQPTDSQLLLREYESYEKQLQSDVQDKGGSVT
ncbi:uncharacterized protein LOC114575839 [Exaiptasia diaphana]|uniref:CCHC-type domain-containing protein n=1 Tax=Exaiptasia diaphana TaxID=2652724 RepID=A0A913YQD2_EXADI|nr:uncharacterized protein LOC114575839 [Exaiptasia diaphana]